MNKKNTPTKCDLVQKNKKPKNKMELLDPQDEMIQEDVSKTFVSGVKNKKDKNVLEKLDYPAEMSNQKSTSTQCDLVEENNGEKISASQIFESLDGIPALKPEYKRVIVDVVEETVRRIDKRNIGGNVEGIKSDFCQKIEVLEKNISAIAKKLKFANSVKQKYIEKSPEWLTRNEQIVTLLNEAYTYLRKHRKNCNISRIIGYITSFLGGGLCLTSAALAPATMGLTLPFAIAGVSMIGTGSTTSILTSVTEAALVKKQVKTTQSILDENKTVLEDLGEFLTHSRELSDAIKNIMNIKFFKDIIEAVEGLFVKAAEIFKCEIREMLVEWIVSPILALLPKGVGCCIKLTAKLITLVLIFIYLKNSNKIVIDCGILATKAVFMASTFSNFAVEMGITVANIFVKNAARKVGLAIARGSVAVISMTIDMVCIILHGIEMKKGSVSKEAKKVGDLVQFFRAEGEIIKQVREMLIKDEEPQVCGLRRNKSKIPRLLPPNENSRSV